MKYRLIVSKKPAFLAFVFPFLQRCHIIRRALFPDYGLAKKNWGRYSSQPDGHPLSLKNA
jgi:hypothetical protein